MAKLLSAREHALIMYREALASIGKFNRAEADYLTIEHQEIEAAEATVGRALTSFERQAAERRADARATDAGIWGRVVYHRERAAMHALAYLMESDFADRLTK